MELIFKHAWMMFIGVTLLNYLILKRRVQEYIDQDPGLKPGYDKLFRALLIYGNAPWVIMGIGNLTTQTNSVFDYFNPQTLNPFVLAFHGYIIVFWILGIRWIYFQKGADFLVKHPGFVHIRGFGNAVTPTPILIKFFFAIALLGGMIGMTMMWLNDFSNLPIK